MRTTGTPENDSGTGAAQGPAGSPRSGAHPGHFGFFLGTDSDDAWAYTDYFERHLRNDHGRYDCRMPGKLDGIPYGYSHKDQQARFTALNAIHRQSHEQELARYQEAEDESPRLAGQTQRRREELEREHLPYAEEERERQEDEQREIREHRENAVVSLHGQNSALAEMEQHLRDVHGHPGHALPEYQLPTIRGQDLYAEALEQEHALDHGEAGTYRHGDNDRAIVVHGALMSPYDAETHLTQQHGFDRPELQHCEYPPEELTAMHVQAHQDQPGQHTEEEFRRDHGLENDERLRYSPDEEGETAGVVPEHYSHDCDWGKLESPSENDVDHGTAARWVPPPPYMPVPHGPGALFEHMAGEHGISQSARSTKPPAEKFLSTMHVRMHAGELPDHGGGTHQHDDPPCRLPPNLSSLQAAPEPSAAPAGGPGRTPARDAGNPAVSPAPGRRQPAGVRNAHPGRGLSVPPAAAR